MNPALLFFSWTQLLFLLSASTKLSLPDLSSLQNAESQKKLFNDYLPNLLVPRVAGTQGNKKVRQYIINHYTKLGWDVEQDTFNQHTLVGEVEFSNIVATKHPGAPYRLVLAAHYDSKKFDDFEFIGATDSAAPCAILLDLSQSLDQLLAKMTPNVTLQVVFFDGEEAFKEWTSTDSIYGARHLAAKWEKENKLKTITAFVLLDLLGSKDTSLVSFHRETDHLFGKLFDIQAELKGRSLLTAAKNTQEAAMGASAGIVNPHMYGGGVEDDHIPFLQRNVPILHAICKLSVL
jgi:glutaminyl-peptide cyclotransferase